MSFGEATSLAHAGRIGELLEEAIHRHKIIFVTSAGNSGPGLGTVGSPAAQAVGTISVGALISRECHGSLSATHGTLGSEF